MTNILEELMRERNICRMSSAEANQLSRECLQLALIQLMGKMPFDKITVTELVKFSGVSRQTFYRNYKSKEDILKEMSEEIKCKLLDTMVSDKYRGDGYAWFYDLFQFIRDNRDLVELLYKGDIIRKNVLGFIPPGYQSVWDSADEDEKYVLIAYEGGLDAIVEKWFLAGMRESVDTMAGICNSLYGEIHCRILDSIHKKTAGS